MSSAALLLGIVTWAVTPTACVYGDGSCGPEFLYVAWSEPVAGGFPVTSKSVYLAADGTLQYARFTDRGELLDLASGSVPPGLVDDLGARVEAWLAGRDGPGNAVEELNEGAPLAIDFQAPRVTVALCGPGGVEAAEILPEADLPTVLVPVVRRARELAGRASEPLPPGRNLRLDFAVVERRPDATIRPPDLEASPPLAAALSFPWRLIPAADHAVSVAREPLAPEFPLFVAFAEQLYLLRAFVLGRLPPRLEHGSPKKDQGANQ